jgi:hypothetical protein
MELLRLVQQSHWANLTWVEFVYAPPEGGPNTDHINFLLVNTL